MHIGWATLAVLLTLSGSRTAVASRVYGPLIAQNYVTEATVDGATEVCLYCHPTVEGEVITKSFGAAMVSQGLTMSNPAKLTELLDALMAELDAVAMAGEPLGSAGAGLLDSDVDEVPDALEIRWGSNPSDPESYLEVDTPGSYRVIAKERIPITYGCGAQVSPSAPQSLGWASLLAGLGVVVYGRRRRPLRPHRRICRTSSTTSGKARGARLPPCSTT